MADKREHKGVRDTSSSHRRSESAFVAVRSVLSVLKSIGREEQSRLDSPDIKNRVVRNELDTMTDISFCELSRKGGLPTSRSASPSYVIESEKSRALWNPRASRVQHVL